MKIARNLKELFKILDKKWYATERRLLIKLLHQHGKKNRKRYLKALVKKLSRKGVMLTPECIIEIYMTDWSKKAQKKQ